MRRMPTALALCGRNFCSKPGGRCRTRHTQYCVYRRILDGRAGRPVTIRTLDAGGDKPIPGVTFEGEAEPFPRRTRASSVAAPTGAFQAHSCARLRAPRATGNLKMMLPMVTTPSEFLADARAHLDAAMMSFNREGLAGAPRPPLGIMVEVPAAALAIDGFDADFYSIGSNDLVQYVTACDRGAGELAALADPLNPARARTPPAHGRARSKDRRVRQLVRRYGGRRAPRSGAARLRARPRFSVAPPALGAPQGGDLRAMSEDARQERDASSAVAEYKRFLKDVLERPAVGHASAACRGDRQEPQLRLADLQSVLSVADSRRSISRSSSISATSRPGAPTFLRAYSARASWTARRWLRGTDRTQDHANAARPGDAARTNNWKRSSSTSCIASLRSSPKTADGQGVNASHEEICQHRRRHTDWRALRASPRRTRISSSLGEGGSFQTTVSAHPKQGRARFGRGQRP